MKKVFAGMSAVAISLTQMGTVFAAYSDVAAGVWYEEAVDAFTDAGYLDASQTRFRGGDNANRAEFTKLVVELNGGILSTAPSVPSFDDVKPGAWYYGYMEEAAKEGWVKGDGNCYGSHPCNARPSANINRAEAAALIVRAFGLEWTGDAPSFVDVPSGQWYTDAVQTAADHCVLQGDDATGRARPADFMNRAEMVVMLYRVDQGLTYGVDCSTEATTEPMIKDVTPTSATTVEVEFNVALDEDAAVDADLYMVSGADDIDVDSVEWIDASTVELTLAESTEVNEDYTVSVEDMMTEDGETFSDSMDFAGYTEIEQGDGILEVSMSSTNPSADTVPKGAVGVVLTSIDVTASCDDSVVISEITVLHEGFGDSSDITGVYAAIDGGRVSRKRSIDSEDQTADLRFSEPLTIAACKSQTIDLVADFNTGIETGAEHNLAVELPSDFQSNAKDVEGNFPIRGNTFRIAAVTSGQISVDYRTISPNEVDVGDTGRVVGKFELSSNSVEDQTVYSVTMEQNGSSSDGDLKNLKIRRTDGTVLTNTVSTTVGDFATFVFDPPFTILEGDNITLEVVADIDAGAGETVVMHFEETSDVFAVGSLYGYGVNGQLYGSRVSIPDDDADDVSIQAGEFTVEVDGPVQQKYTRDDDDAVIAKINLITGSSESIDVQDMFIAIEGQTSTGAGLLANGGSTTSDNIHEILEDVELRNTKTGQTISGVRLSNTNSTDGDFFSSTTETFQIYRFDDFIVDGTTSWELRVDFIDNGGTAHPKSGDRFRAHVCAEPVNSVAGTDGCDFGGLITETESYNLSLEGLSTGEVITDARPGGDITGNFHRIAAPELNIAVKGIGSTDTAVRNSKNINLLRFEARAGEAEDILLTQAVFEAAGGSLLNAQNYALWVDTDGDAVVDTILEKGASAQNDQVSFDDLAGGGYVVPAEETVMFEVHADIASNFTNTLLALRFDTGATSYIEAEEVDDGSSLTGISTNGSSATANIIVTTVYSKLYTLVTGGDLFVTKDSESVRSRQLLGGTLGDSVLRLNFRAQNEDIEVTDIQIASSGSVATSVDRLELYKAGETTAFATATTGGCPTTKIGQTAQNETTFCSNTESRQLVIAKGQDVDVIVRPRMKTDQNGAISGENILFFTGTGGIMARGVNSSTDLRINDDDANTDGEIVIGANTSTSNVVIRGNDNEVVLAKITSITNANPDSDNTNVPTGVRPVGQFRFTAASNSNTLNGVNKAALSGVIFNVSATSVDMNGANFKWYNRDDANAKVACNVVGSLGNSGSLAVRCMDTATINTEIDSGQSVTFVLEADVTSVATNGTLQVSLQSFTDVAETLFGTSDSHLTWLDKDTSSTPFFWVEYGDTVVNSTSYKS